MFKIGEFSRLSQVPVKTLRFYDEIGLFKPSFIDQTNGYRHYELSQFERINQIKMLKDLGFSLEQIANMLDEAFSQDELRRMLHMKLADLENEAMALEQRRTRVQNQLKNLEKESKVSTQEVTIKSVDPIRVISKRAIIENYKSMRPLYDKLYGTLSAQNVSPASACMGVFYDEEYKEKDVDAEAVVPIGDATVTADGGVTVYELPAVTQMATYLRKGPYDDFTPAYQTLMGWISENGYQIVGPNREIYLQSPEDGPPEECLVELQFPVVKRE